MGKGCSSSTRFTGVSDTLAVAHATATFGMGALWRSGEATPENVGRQVRPHFALALAGQGPLSPGCPQWLLCAVEELGGVRGRRAATRSRPGPGV